MKYINFAQKIVVNMLTKSNSDLRRIYPKIFLIYSDFSCKYFFLYSFLENGGSVRTKKRFVMAFLIFSLLLAAYYKAASIFVCSN